MDNFKAISIDDNHINLMLLQKYARKLPIDIANYTDPVKALSDACANEPDIIFIDYMMPEMNGIEFIREFRKQNSNTPIIMVTAVSDDQKIKIDALEAGVTDFLIKPINSIEFIARTRNLLEMRKFQRIVQDKALLLQEEVNKATQKILEREEETIMVLGKISELKDIETGHHILRVAYYSKLLATELGMSEEEIQVLFYASQLHDIGKVGTPETILLKPGKLTFDEFEIMKQHAVNGYKILKNTSSKYLKAGSIVALSHHEWVNGTGYPKGQKNKEIPVYGRILAIADCFDALLSKRPYKERWSFDEAMAYIVHEKGIHFDSELVDLFIAKKDEVKKIGESLMDL
ncbi:HD domain-containing phosphohydrolase [Clostridium lacusfryxellense]|uniref:HD domain-containing phosphohydrolase n=1 Tax=Clostridium lacusfryxellense TaxID=205328 RepID=UPI001C0B20C5|nr:HD domain-containing phosphohydrolase [Clostridium lacusfryxellense]MBU3109990.1 response regulator [Clostridium lacusfryxellense]